MGIFDTINVDEIVLASVKKYPGISKGELHKILNNHMRAVILNTSLDFLEEEGLIRRKRYHTGGRPSECFYPCYYKEESNDINEEMIYVPHCIKLRKVAMILLEELKSELRSHQGEHVPREIAELLGATNFREHIDRYGNRDFEADWPDHWFVV